MDPSTLTKILITYAQNDKVLLEKTADACTVDTDSQSITTTLTQEETFLFDCHFPVQIQLRVLTAEGRVLSTRVNEVSLDKCLSEEVLA
jgi:hypothetical protein